MEEKIRPANKKDIPFIIEAMMAAEQSPENQQNRYLVYFNLSEEEWLKALKRMLEEDTEGSEFGLQNYRILEVDSKPAATCAAWVEAQSEISSAAIKGMLMRQYLDDERIQRASEYLNYFSAIQIQRQPGDVQYEAVYVRPDDRGKGLLSPLFDRQRQRFPAAQRAQVITGGCSNQRAIKAYEKLGFEIKKRVTLPKEKVEQGPFRPPFTENVLLEKELA